MCSCRFVPIAAAGLLLASGAGVDARAQIGAGFEAAPSATASSPEASTRALTLDEAERRLPQANLEVRAAQRALAGARADVERVLVRPNPQLGVDLANNNPNAYGYRSQSQRVRIDQLIERGNKRELRGAAAQGIAEAARADVVEVLRQQRLAMHLAYWDLAGAQARLDIASRNVELLRRLVGAAERRVSAGDLARVDLARLRVDAARVQNEARVAAGDVTAAGVALARLLGMGTDELPVAVEPLPARPDDAPEAARLAAGPADARPVDANPDTDPAGVDAPDRTNDPIETRTDVRAARLRVIAAERQLALVRAQRTRDVIVSGQAEHHGVLGGTVFTVGFAVPLLVFNDFTADIRRAQSDLEGAREFLGRVRAEASAEIRRAAAALATAADRLRRARDAIVPDAERAAAGVEFAFNRGAAGLTDLLDAQRVRAGALRDAADAAADYARAQAAWRAAMQWERNVR